MSLIEAGVFTTSVGAAESIANDILSTIDLNRLAQGVTGLIIWGVVIGAIYLQDEKDERKLPKPPSENSSGQQPPIDTTFTKR